MFWNQYDKTNNKMDGKSLMDNFGLYGSPLLHIKTPQVEVISTDDIAVCEPFTRFTKATLWLNVSNTVQ